MNKNSYSMVEGILKGYPKLKVEIDNLKLDLEEVNEVVGISGDSGNERAGSSTNAFSSVVENEVLEREKNLKRKIKELTNLIQRKERQLKKIENILGMLTEYEMQLIEMRYFKRYSVGRICDILELTEDGFNKKRKRLIREILIPLFVL